MKFSVSVQLLSLLILFATTTFTQAVNGQPDVLLSQPMDSAAAVEEEEIIEPEQIDVVHTSFQIIRPFTDNVTNRKRLSINKEAMNALEAYFKNNTDDDGKQTNHYVTKRLT